MKDLELVDDFKGFPSLKALPNNIKRAKELTKTRALINIRALIDSSPSF